MIAPTQQPPALAPTMQVIDDRGVMCLEIPDNEGRVISYTLERDWTRPGVALVVRRVDCEAGPYVVSKEPGRLWRCTCPAWKYKAGAYAAYGCKHVRACRAVFGQAVRLTQEQTP